MTNKELQRIQEDVLDDMAEVYECVECTECGQQWITNQSRAVCMYCGSGAVVAVVETGLNYNDSNDMTIYSTTVKGGKCG